MIVLLGASGYVGQAFEQELQRRGAKCFPLSRRQLDYSHFDVLLKFLRETRPSFLVNAAGYTGKPNVDACETARADTLQGNTLLPQTIAQACAATAPPWGTPPLPQTVAQACAATGTPWGHVSSGCIFTGAWIVEGGQRRVEKDS